MKQTDHKVEKHDVMIENKVASIGPISDIDMAAEVSNLIKRQLLQQSSAPMLVQANARAKAVLSLLT
jgi:flagellin-like hook-associated protein FlgL